MDALVKGPSKGEARFVSIRWEMSDDSNAARIHRTTARFETRHSFEVFVTLQ